MKKNKLNGFIKKYGLSGNVNSVVWKVEDNVLNTSFVTADKSLLGNLEVCGVDLENGEVGIYSTDQLDKLLGVLGDDIKLSLNKVNDKPISLKVNDNNNISVNYTLSETSVIGTPPKLKRTPPFGIKIKMDSDFVNTFIKGKSALSDVDSFTLVSNNGSVDCIIGYSSTNTNRINIPTNLIESDLEKPISFNANLFKEVLVANKECTSAILEVAKDGLMKMNFKVDDFDVTYYLVAMQDND